MKIVFLGFNTFFLFLIGCSSVTDYEGKLHEIASREKAIDCELQYLRDSVGMEWEHVAAMMEERLPASMPMEEKNNMLQAKNANLIRMFESYETLNDEVKMAVDKAERKDESIASQIMQFRKEKQKIENERMQILGLASQDGSSDTERLRQVYNEVLKEDCE